MRQKNIDKLISYLVVILLLSTILTGCGAKEKKYVLTTGFSKGEVFRVGESSCSVPEIMVYLTNLQNQYEEVYGDRIWETTIDGKSLSDNVKDVALSRIAQVKTMALLAKQQGITLDDRENDKVDNITDIYFDSLTSQEKSSMEIDRDIIHSLYEEYALATKVYESIIRDVNPEISDDEARTITVSHIFIKTYNYDDDGNKVGYNSERRNEAKQLAEEIRQRIVDGEDFEVLAKEYSNDEEVTISFGKGEKDKEFETAAFELGTDELSEVVETEFGYQIIKCLSTFNREVTDDNKIKIVEKRKQEVFSEEYEEFANGLTKGVNEELWDSIEFVHGANITTHNFFEIFDENYKNQ